MAIVKSMFLSWLDFKAEFIRESNEPEPPSGSPEFCSPTDSPSDIGRATEFWRFARWCWFV